MPLVGFEPKIAVFERAKTVHGLDGAATAIGMIRPRRMKFAGYIARGMVERRIVYCDVLGGTRD
jgi:hypothetical protein